MNNADTWPEDVEALIEKAMDGALETHNYYSDFIRALTSNYYPEVPTAEDRDELSQRAYIRGDAQHFWPYGLNQAAEHQSE